MHRIKNASLYAAILPELTTLLLNNDNRKSDIDSIVNMQENNTMHR